MSNASATFELACEVLELVSPLSRLEARGTLRLALKRAGLEARTIDGRQMQVVVERILAGELATRGVDPEKVLPALLHRLRNLANDDVCPDSPEAIFGHLGGDS